VLERQSRDETQTRSCVVVVVVVKELRAQTLGPSWEEVRLGDVSQDVPNVICLARCLSGGQWDQARVHASRLVDSRMLDATLARMMVSDLPGIMIMIMIMSLAALACGRLCPHPPATLPRQVFAAAQAGDPALGHSILEGMRKKGVYPDAFVGALVGRAREKDGAWDTVLALMRDILTSAPNGGTNARRHQVGKMIDTMQRWEDSLDDSQSHRSEGSPGENRLSDHERLLVPL
jgi:hypothetical protein